MKLRRAQKECGGRGFSRRQFNVCVKTKMGVRGRFGRGASTSSGGSGGGAGANSPTRTEVRSPTRTSTEVRSPTSTSTDAYTNGNITVTGGAGDGATTEVHVYPCAKPDPTSKSGKAAKRERRMQRRASRAGRAPRTGRER